MPDRAQLERALRAAHTSGDEVSARRLAAALAETPRKQFSAGQIAAGVADVIGSSIRGTINEPATTLAGLAGAVNPNDTYMDAKARARAQIEMGDALVPSEGLRTEAGPAIANVIALSPGMQQIGMALDAIGDGIEKIAGPEARDVVESAMTLATLRSPRTLAKPRVPTPPAAQAVDRMRNAGFTVPGHTPTGPGGATAGTASERVLAGVAGGERVDAMISVANQDVASRWISRGGRLDTEFVEPAAVQRAIKNAELPYEELRQAGIAVQPDMTLLQDASRIINEAGQVGTPAVRAVRDLTKPLSVDHVIDSVRQLRQQGFKRMASDNVEAQEIGDLQIKAADALDAVLERSLSREAAAAAQTDNATLAAVLKRLHGAYVDGRAWRADLHIIEDVMNPSTGSIDPARLARIGERRRLNPQLQVVADAYRTSPSAMQKVESASRAAQLGTMDVAMGGGVQSVRSAAGLGTLIGSMLGRQAARRAASAPRKRGLEAMRARNRRRVARATALAQSVDNEEERQ